MGCYGIGVSRLIAAIIEQNNDENGIIWPVEVSPYQVLILPLDVTQGRVMQPALDIHRKLEQSGITTLLDDRDERAGVKFKDADLIGIPVVITIGPKSLEQGKVEIKKRQGGEALLVEASGAVEAARQLLAQAGGNL